MSRRILLGIALVASLPLAGCTAGHDPAPKPSPPRLANAMRLVAFDSCEQLRDDLRTAAKESVGPWGLGGDESVMRAATPEGARSAVDGAADAPSASKTFSGTNVHEAGVDEPDVVKTDGRRIVTLDLQGDLRVVDVAAKKQTGKLRLGGDGRATNLLLAGDRALVLIPGGGGRPNYRLDDRKRYFSDVAEVVLVDLTGAPRVISRFQSDGRLVDARQNGDTARVVLTSSPRIDFPDLPGGKDDDDRIEANRKAIDKAPLDAWLPEWSVATDGVTERGRVGCGDVRRPAVFSGRSMLSVLTFDLKAPKLDNGRPVAIVADGDTVYGTPTSLYVANDQRWRLNFGLGRDNRSTPQETEIYKFDVTGAAPPVYAAAGKVEGWLINQYAMSEWDGHLRVATTNDQTSVSAVRVLRPDGDTLKLVGEVGGLGKTEQIYSVRFIGARGYVVTFRQTDPLYSLDLSDPAKPKVTGELKISGYSAHLQPVGEDRLIGIGQEADAKGRVQGLQVSLFDVSDPAEPRRLAQQVIKDGHSTAEYNPHAILWWPDTKLLVVPVTTYGELIDGGSGDQPSALALRVTDNGLTQVGKITGKRLQAGYTPQIERSMVIGDELWTKSEAGLTASSLSTLDEIAVVPNS